MLDGKGMDFESRGVVEGAYLRIGRANDEVLKANHQIDLANAEILRLRAELAQAQAALNLEVAHRTGILAQGRAFRAELTKLQPSNALLRPTGRKFDNGQAQIGADVVYDAAFDAKAKELRLPDPKRIRAVAK